MPTSPRRGQVSYLFKLGLVDSPIDLLYRFYVNAYADRDTTVGEGFFINNEHFDVHRFHPPLIYGRRGGPDDGEGIALCRYKPRNPQGSETY